ncbi:MAG TPA: hypothetical protein VNM66_07955, partial [Thermodesulfobacteriota bacterium]|nr:hypothetical protein [Thermodesulfobacteriota bacterium]
ALALGALLAVAVGAAAGVALTLAGRRGDAEPIAVLRTADFHSLAMSPADPDVVFFGHHHGVMRSDDGGRTWRPLVAQPGFDAMGMAVSRAAPRRADTIYVAGHDVFQASTDGGASWQPLDHDLPGTDIHGFAMSPDDPDRLYAFVVGHGLFRSEDGGRTWRRPGGELPADVTALAAAGGSPEVLYAGSLRFGVLRSADGGRTWVPATTGLASRRVFALAVDPAARRTVYAGLDDGLYRSDDGGASWGKLPYPGRNAVALAVSPLRPGVLLAIAVDDRQGLVFRSEDGGASWGRAGVRGRAMPRPADR